MAKSTKSYEERMLEMEKKEQESLEKAKRYAAQKKELLKRKKAEESKKRTHRLCQVGGAVESVLGSPIEEEDMLYYYPHYDVCNHIPKAIPNKAVYGRFRNKSYDY